MKLESPKAKKIRFITALLVSVLLAMALPIYNGGPAIYHDTTAYLKHAAKVADLIFSPFGNTGNTEFLSESQPSFVSTESYNVVESGRSLYYGLLLYAGWKSSLWLPIIVQAGTLAWLVLLLFQLVSPPAWPYKAGAALLLISLFSSASFFAGLLMPDIWAGILILAFALLWVFGDRLSLGSTFAMLAILTFSVLAHASHLLLLAVVTLLMVVLWALKLDRQESLLRKLAVPLIAVTLGVVGMVSWGLAVTVGYGAKILDRPFLTAHLTDMGPGTRYLKQSCPESGFVLCDFKDRLPLPWHSFLFNPSPETGVFGAVSDDVRLAIAEEQTAFVLGTLTAEPISTITGLIQDGLTQLWTLSITNVALDQRHETYLLENAPPGFVDQLRKTRAYHDPNAARTLEQQTQLVAILSLLILAVWFTHSLSRSPPADQQASTVSKVIIVLIAGMVSNALICGILASPYGRFQARVIWLLPVIATVILASQPVAFKKPRWLPQSGGR